MSESARTESAKMNRWTPTAWLVGCILLTMSAPLVLPELKWPIMFWVGWMAGDFYRFARANSVRAPS